MNTQSVIKSVQDIMRKDAGVDGDAQRIAQLVWMLFLKVFDVKEKEWELMCDEEYQSIIPEKFRWGNWAEDDEGITGEELLHFINDELFTSLKELPIAENTDPKVVLVQSVFQDSFNYMKSGSLIRSVINKLNEIDFKTDGDRHSFNDIYEKILNDLRSAGNAGEYYTPRAVTQFMVDMVNPQLGEKVLDFACGTGGFLICALEHLRKQVKVVEDEQKLQESVFGVEKKPLPHALCTTNMILHGLDSPKIKHDNSLAYPIKDDHEKVDIILANPPFGGIEEDGIEDNFPKKFKTKETSDLFMVLLMHKIKQTGRAGIVLPDGFLSGTGVKTAIKEKLLNEFNVHTIVRMPSGVFAPYSGITVNLLFMNRGKTKEIWYYQHPLPEGYKNYTKTKPIKLDEFSHEKEWWKQREENEFAWKLSIEEIKKREYNLDVKNPYSEDNITLLSPIEIMRNLNQSQNNIGLIMKQLEGVFTSEEG